MYHKYSVLMSTYYNDNTDDLRASINSMLNQSYPPDDFVLVCDGPLTADANNLILQYQNNHPDLFQIIRLHENQGLGPALNEGLLYCKNDWVARMDSDDISHPDRCEKQLLYAERNKLDLCSAWVTEFDPIKKETRIKQVPETMDAIEHMAHRRSPINHPCVIFRKSAVIAAGGYRDQSKFEDYDLWIRMIINRSNMGNIQESLLDMCAGDDLYQRRGGVTYCRQIKDFCKHAYQIGFFTKTDRFFNTLTRCTVSLLPNKVRSIFYKVLLRKNKGQKNETV